jgi:zinc transport system substrate-binding protein
VRTRIILISLLALLIAGAAALYAAGSDDDEDGSGRVVAGFYPVAFAAEEVGAPEVENLTPPGAEPHDVEVSASDVEEVQEADLVLLMGRDFQPQLEDAAAGAGGEVVEILDTSGLDLLRGGGEDDEHGQDPHVWLDPRRYTLVVERIAGALEDPEAAMPMVEQLDQLDAEFRAGLSDCERREIVTSHEAFGYLADRYGLEQIAVTGLSPEAEPSPTELSDVVEEVRSSGATTVFSETLVSPDLAETVARETGAETAVLNPIEGLTAEEQDRGEDYFSLMRENLAQLRAALECR